MGYGTPLSIDRSLVTRPPQAVSAILIALAITVSSLSSAAPPAHASTDVFIDVELATLADIRDSTGDPVTVSSDGDNGLGNREITGVTATGDPFRVLVYQGLDPNDEDVMTETIAVAMTPTTISTSWLATGSEHSATLAEQTMTSTVPFVAFTGLGSGRVYPLRLESLLPSEIETTAHFQQTATGGLSLVNSPPPGSPPTTATSSTSAVLSVQTLAPGPTASARNAPLSASSVATTELNYRTFIPWATIHEGGNDLDRFITETCIDWATQFDVNAGATSPALVTPFSPFELTFRGDNRNFRPPSDDIDYRTSVNLTMDWSESGADRLQHEVLTGYTDVVRSAVPDDVAGTRQASTDGIDVIVRSLPWWDPDELVVRIHHDANDPYCPADMTFTGSGAIGYDVTIVANPDGTLQMHGSRATMPAHEVWVRWNDDPWSPLFLGDASELACLIAYPLSLTNTVAMIRLNMTIDWVECRQRIVESIERTRETWQVMSVVTDGTVIDPFRQMVGVTTGGRALSSGFISVANIEQPSNSQCNVVGWYTAPTLNASLTVEHVEVNNYGPAAAFYLTDEGHLYSWGDDPGRRWPYRDQSLLGRGGDGNVPQRVDHRVYTQVQAWHDHVLALTSDGDVYRWGRDIGSPNAALFSPVPILEVGGQEVVEIAGQTLLTSDGRVFEYRETVTDEATGAYTEGWTQLNFDGLSVTDIEVSAAGSFAIDELSRLWGWYIWDGSPVTIADDPNDPDRPYYIEDPSLVVSQQSFESLIVDAVINSDGETIFIPNYESDLYLDDAPVIAEPPALDEHGRDAQGDVWTLTRPSYWGTPPEWQRIPRPATVAASPADAGYQCY